MRNYEDIIVGHVRARNFFSLSNALLIAANGDLEQISEGIDRVNRAHAKAMSEMAARFRSAPQIVIRQPSEQALAPFEIVEAFADVNGDVRLRFNIPGWGVYPEYPV